MLKGSGVPVVVSLTVLIRSYHWLYFLRKFYFTLFSSFEGSKSLMQTADRAICLGGRRGSDHGKCVWVPSCLVRKGCGGHFAEKFVKK